MAWYLTVKVVHIVSATVLFGTGLGIAFFMLRSHFVDNLDEKIFAIRNTVLADYLFTLPAAVLQPLTGAWLVWRGPYQWTDTWLLWTVILYVVAGLCWLPVVWIQIQLKTMLLENRAHGVGLPLRYRALFRIWFMLGWPAFISLLLIFLLMVFRPA